MSDCAPLLALLELSNAIRSGQKIPPKKKETTKGPIESIIDDMKQHPDDPERLDDGIAMLSGYALVPHNNNVLVKCGGVEVIIGAMKKHIEETMLVMSCLGVLQNVAVNPNHWQRLREAGVVKTSMLVVNHHKSFDAIQAIGAFLFHTLARDEEFRKSLAKNGAIEAVATGMQLHKTFSEMQMQGCLALNRFASDVVLFPKIFRAKGVAALFDILEHHPQNMSLVTPAFQLLVELSSKCKVSDRPEFNEQANVKVLSKMIRSNKSILQYACFLLKYLAFCVPEKVLRDGGADALVYCMKTNRTEMDLQMMCCHGLRDVFSSCKDLQENMQTSRSMVMELLSRVERDYKDFEYLRVLASDTLGLLEDAA